jgi:hypothetical protein
MPSLAIAAQGTKIQRGNGASPEVFTDIPDCTNIAGLGSGEAEEFEVTGYASTAIEVRLGLPDEGTITFALNYVPSDPQHEGLLADRDSLATATPILRNFRVILPNTAKTFSLGAYVKQFTIDPQLKDAVKAHVSLRVSGSITRV